MTDHARTQRRNDELRTVSLQRDAAPYAEGSCLVRFGRTEVLCTATVEAGVPRWREGQGAGWVTAEYAMLPRATQERTRRERNGAGGRTREIQRLIGRSLRAATDLEALGQNTILLDCDVVMADGGTRTASITGAAVALHDACAWLVRERGVARNAMRELVAAVSVGIFDGDLRLDLEYCEDVAADVDMNLVALESGGLVEVQGTAEGRSFDRTQLDELLDLGLDGIQKLSALQRKVLND
ncbi:MAG: ribonuclease PH [Gemmatimonadota bacterium]|jgi:ribonuclease PH